MNLHELIIKDKYDSGGRCDTIKGGLIKDLILKTNAKLCVEIGVFKGSSLMYFIEALQITGGKVIGIDPYKIEDFKNEIPNKSVNNLIYNVLFTEQQVLENIYINLKTLLNKNNLEKNVQLIREKSENYCNNFDKESIDVLHIDGNHDEYFVTKDIVNYLPLVKSGGFILMDDITWPGVKKSIDLHLVNYCNLISSFPEYSIYQKK